MLTASQTVYLTLDRSKAVPEGDKAAQFLLVKQGQEISEAQVEKYEGAIELVGGTKKAAHGVESRTPAIETRDPEAKPATGKRKRERHS